GHVESNRGRHAAGCRHTLNSQGAAVGSKYDHSCLVPGATTAGWSVAQGYRRTSGRIDLLELSAREESDEPAIGRPERMDSALGSRQRLCRERIERPHPKLILTLRALRAERDAASVRRERYWTNRGQHAREVECGPFRRRNVSAKDRRWRRNFAEVDKGEHG